MVSCEIISAMFCSFSSCARSFALSGLKLVKHPATTGHSTIQVCEGVLPRSPKAASYSAMTRASESLKSRNLDRSEEHTSELQSLRHLVCRLLLEKKKKR